MCRYTFIFLNYFLGLDPSSFNKHYTIHYMPVLQFPIWKPYLIPRIDCALLTLSQTFYLPLEIEAAKPVSLRALIGFINLQNNNNKQKYIYTITDFKDSQPKTQHYLIYMLHVKITNFPWLYLYDSH